MSDYVSVTRKAVCAAALAAILLHTNLAVAEIPDGTDGFSLDYVSLTRASRGDPNGAVRVLVRGEVGGSGGDARSTSAGLADSGQWKLTISFSADDGEEGGSLELRIPSLTCRRDTRCQAVVRGESGTLVKLEVVLNKAAAAWTFAWKGVLPLPPGVALRPVPSSVQLCMRDGRLCRSATVTFEQQAQGMLVAARKK